MVTGGKIWYVTCILHFIWILLRNLTFTLPTFKKIAVIPPYVSVCLLTVNSEISQWVILMPYPKMPIREHQEVWGAMVLEHTCKTGSREMSRPCWTT